MKFVWAALSATCFIASMYNLAKAEIVKYDVSNCENVRVANLEIIAECDTVQYIEGVPVTTIDGARHTYRFRADGSLSRMTFKARKYEVSAKFDPSGEVYFRKTSFDNASGDRCIVKRNKNLGLASVTANCDTDALMYAGNIIYAPIAGMAVMFEGGAKVVEVIGIYDQLIYDASWFTVAAEHWFFGNPESGLWGEQYNLGRSSAGLLVVGDSIWAKAGRLSEQLNGTDWGEIAPLWNATIGHGKWFNAAIGGAATAQCMRQLDENILPTTERVFIACGTNNILWPYFNGNEEVAGRLTAVAQVTLAYRALWRAPDANVVLDLIDYSLIYRREQIRSVSTPAILAFAEAGNFPSQITVSQVQVEAGLFASDYPDGLHPSPAQGLLMAGVLTNDIFPY